jgi:hypothetical protein
MKSHNSRSSIANRELARNAALIGDVGLAGAPIWRKIREPAVDVKRGLIVTPACPACAGLPRKNFPRRAVEPHDVGLSYEAASPA